MPTASQAVKMARYHPQTSPINPKPPAICNNLAICSTSASVVAVPTLKSAAAMKLKSPIRPKNVAVKNRLTRNVPMKKTNEAITLGGSQFSSEPWGDGSLYMDKL